MEWNTLDGSDRKAFWSTVDFLDGRLPQASTVEWALGLGLERRAERLALTYLLHRKGIMALGEPWVAVWGLIEESWAAETPGLASSPDHEIGRRIAGGDRSGALVPLIAALVAPSVSVLPRGPWDAEPNDPPRVPGDLVRVSLRTYRKQRKKRSSDDYRGSLRPTAGATLTTSPGSRNAGCIGPYASCVGSRWLMESCPARRAHG